MGTLGIDNLRKLFTELALIVEDGYTTFKDGVQIWDVAFIPRALKRVVVIGKSFPDALKESKDLQIEEIAELIGDFANTVLGIFDKYKKLK